MIAELMHALVEITIATSVATVIVALLRRPLRRFFGSQLAYWSWMLIPASALFVSLPGASHPMHGVAAGFFPVARTASADTTLWSASTEFIADAAAHDHAIPALLVWSVVSLCMLVFVWYRQWSFVRSLGTLTRAPDGTYRSASASSPMLVGIWRTRIVVPADFESLYCPTEQLLILTHEQMHRRRRDTLTNAFAALCRSLFWFNPLMYWAVSRLRFDQELACDAAVLAVSGMQRHDYAQALLKAQLTEDAGWRASLGCHWQPIHPLQERIAMIKLPLPGTARRWSGAVLMTILLTSGSYAVWAAQPEPAPVLQSTTVRVVANSITTSAGGGKVEYSGNVTVTMIQRNGRTWTVSADRVTSRPDGTAVAVGSVRVRSGEAVLISDRAVIQRDGTIKMNSVEIWKRSGQWWPPVQPADL